MRRLGAQDKILIESGSNGADGSRKHIFPSSESDEHLAIESEWLEEASASFLVNPHRYIRVKMANPSKKSPDEYHKALSA